MAMTDDPFDHNAECTFCDEQAMHAADCPWIAQLVAEVERLQTNYTLLSDDYKQLLIDIERLTAATKPRCDVPDHLELLVDLSTTRAEVEWLRALVDAVGEDVCKLALREQKRHEDQSPDT